MCMSCCYRNVIAILTFGSGVGRYDQNITSLISYRYFIVSPRLSHESAAPSGQSESTCYPDVHSQPLFFSTKRSERRSREAVSLSSFSWWICARLSGGPHQHHLPRMKAALRPLSAASGSIPALQLWRRAFNRGWIYLKANILTLPTAGNEGRKNWIMEMNNSTASFLQLPLTSSAAPFKLRLIRFG